MPKTICPFLITAGVILFGIVGARVLFQVADLSNQAAWLVASLASLVTGTIGYLGRYDC